LAALKNRRARSKEEQQATMSFKSRLAWRAKLPRSADSLNGWLRERGSLTERLQARGSFAVRLLRQGLATPTLDEAVAIGIKRNRLLWVREVALRVDEVPLVFAHTVLPSRPRGPLTGWFARLGTRSLGALLFAHPRFSRGEIRCQRLDHRHALFQPAIDALQLTGEPPPTLWARRSRFAFGAQSVLVTEVFSPALGDV
jgi:chorismate--pyruvate lyase